MIFKNEEISWERNSHTPVLSYVWFWCCYVWFLFHFLICKCQRIIFLLMQWFLVLCKSIILVQGGYSYESKCCNKVLGVSVLSGVFVLCFKCYLKSNIYCQIYCICTKLLSSYYLILIKCSFNYATLEPTNPEMYTFMFNHNWWHPSLSGNQYFIDANMNWFSCETNIPVIKNNVSLIRLGFN